ncbi:hypothetical protein Cmtc_17650 [Cupriavidus sp. TKC]|nr:hypothetical protein Cmtc_17650 [Cupriavidus sp. TKC]HBD33983.1 hypothetical protein [Cupriavidus sp.]HBO80022.1 hypothetical protein [Cupriavidus sp.]
MFWGTGSLTSKPRFDLGGWSIVETDRGEKHLVGIDLENGTGQVSSTVVRFDTRTMRCETASGRIYVLHETTGVSTREAWYVWDGWCRLNGVKSWTDVTSRYRQDMPSA